MQYYLDLKTKTIDDLKQKLTTEELIPSHKILLDDIEERFALLKEIGINTMYDIRQILKTKPKVDQFVRNTGLPFEYLIVLRRQVYSYEPKARKIQDFSCINEDVKTKLLVDGIKTTVHLFEKVATIALRHEFKKEMELTDDDVVLLAKLTDLCRLRYVNADFATLLVNSDYDTVGKIKKANHTELFQNITDANTGKTFYKGKIGLKDMGFLIHDAQFISSAIEL